MGQHSMMACSVREGVCESYAVAPTDVLMSQRCLHNLKQPLECLNTQAPKSGCCYTQAVADLPVSLQA